MSISGKIYKWLRRKTTPKCPAVKDHYTMPDFFETSMATSSASGIHPIYSNEYKRVRIGNKSMDTDKEEVNEEVVSEEEG